jgi:hypothetical protein
VEVDSKPSVLERLRLAVPRLSETVYAPALLASRAMTPKTIIPTAPMQPSEKTIFLTLRLRTYLLYTDVSYLSTRKRFQSTVYVIVMYPKELK